MCGLVSERKHAPKSNGKNTAHKARGRESAENAEAVQRAFPRPPAPFFVFLRKGSVLVCGARARSAKVCGAATAAPQCLKAALVYAKHTPRYQKTNFFFAPNPNV